ncbi:MAG: plasmid stabilization protein [Firmicutes bacterium]|nr:plasmid stabilization protein [Bacillota bacterium]
MMPKIIYTDSYIKKAEAFLKKHPEMIGQYEKTLRLLELNPGHPSLKLHKLKGKHTQLYAVAINISYRISLLFMIQDNNVVPVNFGPHDEVY